MRVDPYSGVPNFTSLVDRFDDANVDTNVWGTAVTPGGTAISEVGGELRFLCAAGAAGLSYLPSKYRFGNYSIVEVQIKVVDGEIGGDGERCEVSAHLYKDDDNYIKWGVYRDTSEAVNSGGYLRYNIAGAGEGAVDVTAVAIDNNYHTFKLILYESAVEVWYDNDYQTSFAFPDLINYEVRLEAGTQNAGDTIDIRFDTFKMLNLADPFGTDLTGVTGDLATLLTRLSAVRAGYLDNLNIGGVVASGTNLTTHDTNLGTHDTNLTNHNTSLTNHEASQSTHRTFLTTNWTAARAAYLDNLAGHQVNVPGSGTLVLTNANAVALEFTTATHGSVFELTFIADINEVDTNGAADTILTVTMWKKFAGAYPTLPNDIYAWQKDATLDRNMDLDHIRCGEDTKIQFKLDLVPGANVNIPYRYIIRRLRV